MCQAAAFALLERLYKAAVTEAEAEIVLLRCTRSVRQVCSAPCITVHVQCTYGARAGHVLPTHVHCAALTRRFHPLRRVVGTPTWHSAEALEGLLRNAVAAGVAPRFCSQVRARISELGRERGDMVPRHVGRGRPAEACHSSLAWPTSWGRASPGSWLRDALGVRRRAAQGRMGEWEAVVRS